MDLINNIYSNIQIQEFLTWEQATNDTIDVKKIYIDIADDLVAGILLSQLVFWYLPNKSGNTKLRVVKKGQLWIAKSREEWFEEIRITPKQFDLACKKLVERKLIEKEVFKFSNKPMVHIKLNFENLIMMVNEKIKSMAEENAKQAEQLVFDQTVKTQEPHEDSFLPKGEKPSSLPLGKNLVFDERLKSITEITTETILTENTTTTGDNESPPGSDEEVPLENVVDAQENLEEIKKKIEKTIGAPFHNGMVKELFKKKGLKQIEYYLKNFKQLTSGLDIDNVSGYFYKAVMDEYIIPKKASFSKNKKPIQTTNYDQRTYDDDFFESVYENLRG